jgi:DNA polymerase III sliding clamp (beta) subunit (PCNA family)
MTTTTLERPATVQPNSPLFLIALPAHLLHCVAQVVCTDPVKVSINKISLYREDSVGSGDITLAATDGHRLMRITLPAGSTQIGELEPGQRLIIDPAAFKKRPLTYEKTIELFADGTAEIINSSSREVRKVFWKTTDTKFEFPNYDQLIPDNFHNKPEAPFAFNPSYLLDFLKLAKQYGSNLVVKWRMNAATTPMIQTFHVDRKWLPLEGEVTVEHLLMPVQVRA